MKGEGVRHQCLVEPEPRCRLDECAKVRNPGTGYPVRLIDRAAVNAAAFFRDAPAE